MSIYRDLGYTGRIRRLAANKQEGRDFFPSTGIPTLPERRLTPLS